jgi:hypothetical protein
VGAAIGGQLSRCRGNSKEVGLAAIPTSGFGFDHFLLERLGCCEVGRSKDTSSYRAVQLDRTSCDTYMAVRNLPIWQTWQIQEVARKLLGPVRKVTVAILQMENAIFCASIRV